MGLPLAPHLSALSIYSPFSRPLTSE